MSDHHRSTLRRLDKTVLGYSDAMRTKTIPPHIRLSIPVSLEAHASFLLLANSMQRSLGSVMGSFLDDSAPAALSMAQQVAAITGKGKNVQAEILALADRIHGATDAVIAKAQAGSVGERRGPACGVGPGDKRTLTPPSSNTGGKVPSKPKKPKFPVAKVQAYADTNGVPPVPKK
jgi:hypothetical protein